jgi:hypothetical protein
VKFRPVSPDPSEFPRLRLLVPPFVPVFVAAVAKLAELGGHLWNVHGDAILMFFLFYGSAAAALVSSLVSTALAIPKLRRHPSLRTWPNIFSVFVASVYVLVAISGLIYGIAHAT